MTNTINPVNIKNIFVMGTLNLKQAYYFSNHYILSSFYSTVYICLKMLNKRQRWSHWEVQSKHKYGFDASIQTKGWVMVLKAMAFFIALTKYKKKHLTESVTQFMSSVSQDATLQAVIVQDYHYKNVLPARQNHFLYKTLSIFISYHCSVTGVSIMCHYWCMRQLSGTIRLSGKCINHKFLIPPRQLSLETTEAVSHHKDTLELELDRPWQAQDVYSR